jgi:hypothetical protein
LIQIDPRGKFDQSNLARSTSGKFPCRQDLEPWRLDEITGDGSLPGVQNALRVLVLIPLRRTTATESVGLSASHGLSWRDDLTDLIDDFLEVVPQAVLA